MKRDLTGKEMPQTGSLKLGRTWDLPGRLFHWALVATVCTGWYLGEYRDFSTINLHFYLGYATGGLIVFRLLWGLVGSEPMRLRHLIPGPGRTVAYASGLLRRQPSGENGHNPLGALSALVMIIVIAVLVITGLFAEDDTMFSSGPFAGLIDDSLVVTMTALHYWAGRALLALVGLHLLAILFYLVWKRENLITPMITGWKWIR